MLLLYCCWTAAGLLLPGHQAACLVPGLAGWPPSRLPHAWPPGRLPGAGFFMRRCWMLFAAWLAGHLAGWLPAQLDTLQTRRVTE